MSLKNRIIAATPIISTIIFLTVGFTTNVWNPTWAVFFLILIVPVVLSDDFYKNIFPITIIVVYLSLGFTLGIWHPLWVIFLLIPVYYIIFEPIFKKRNKGIKIEFIEK